VTGHTAGSGAPDEVDWPALATLGGTLVFYMGVKTMPDIVARLMAEGIGHDTPAAVVENAGMSCQRTVVGSTGNIADRARDESIRPPALLIIGSVVSLYPRLAWFEKLPLFGKRIAVTRATARVENMTARLRALGAEVFEIPTIAIRPLELDDEDRARLEEIAGYDGVVLTSPAAVEILVDRLRDLDLDVRSLAGVKIAAVGESTSSTLQGYGLRADIVPDEFTADSLGERLRDEGVSGLRFLLPRSGKARAGLVEQLLELGAVVDEVKTYEPVPAQTSRDRIEEVLALQPDFITFTSSSTVENLVRIIGDEAFEAHRAALRAASIGPATTRTLKGFGLNPVVEADTHTVGGLIEAMEQFVESGRVAGSEG
jgi:uroporphyrinogen III methyltransferase/synthase